MGSEGTSAHSEEVHQGMLSKVSRLEVAADIILRQLTVELETASMQTVKV